MPVLAPVVSAMLAALLFFNFSFSAPKIQQYNDILIYHVETKKGPAKIIYKEPNSIKISYKKNGDTIEFSYERDLKKDIPPQDKEYIDQIVEQVIKHSDNKGIYKRCKNTLIDFRDYVLRKPNR